ncbi:MAG: radical SAM protein [Blastocatellia bacterium]
MPDISSNGLVTLNSEAPLLPPELEFVNSPVRRIAQGRVLLFKTPFFTPWTPPLGIAILKSYLQSEGIQARCYDFNTDLQLWDTHHRYFNELQSLEHLSINDGYSKLWWILNAHSLAYVNGASAAECAELIRKIAPLYAIKCNDRVIHALTNIIEQHFKRLDSLLNRLDLSGVSVVGTSTYTTSLASSLFVLRKLKQNNPAITTIMGGGVFADDLALGSENLEILVREYPFIDHVILGEGERLLLELIRGNLAHKRVISIADLNRVTMEMNEVPVPDFGDFNIEDYYHLTIEGARSCPFECSFCSETIQWGKYRKKPMEAFADQVIDMARRYKNRSFFMGDSLMNPYIIAFSGELLKKKADIFYDGYLRADKVAADADRVSQWAKSGLCRVRLGVESASANVLKAMHKMTTPQVISDALKYLATAGVRTTTYWIAGFPGETESDFEETLDFIREHRHYIYELEAHPFYYYPYGQVGSRFYNSASLYPDDVTKLVKFRVWDIVDANPNRYERYQRLSRISEMAADLGLINIYTMEARYDAEERWRILHPLCREVFKGAWASRLPVELSAETFKKERSLEAQVRQQSPGPGSVMCFRVTVKRAINVEVLQKALKELVRYNDVLNMRCDEEAAAQVPSPWGVVRLHETVQVGQPQQAFAGLLREYVAEMRPSPPHSLRVALAACEDGTSELFLMIHRAVADARGMVLLLEDLFRIYTQMTHDFEVSLLPVARSYSQLMKDAIGDASARDLIESCDRYTQLTSSRGQGQVVTASLGTELTTPKALEQLNRQGLSRERFLLNAILRVLRARYKGQANLSIATTIDGRAEESSLQTTAGPLTCARPLDAGQPDVRLWRPLAGRLAEAARIGRGESEGVVTPASALQVLINFEFLVDSPWMDDKDWEPQGPFIEWGQIASYDLEIIPVPDCGGRLLVRFHTRDDHNLATETSSLAQALSAEVKAGLEQIRRLTNATLFWEREFNTAIQELSVAEDLLKPVAGDKGIGSASLTVQPDIVLRLEEAYAKNVETLMLAAYFILLSRLSGHDDVLVINSSAEDGRVEEFPLRMRVRWDDHVSEFISAVEQKQRLAGTHSTDALRIIDKILRKAKSAPLAEKGRAGFTASEGPASASGFDELFPACATGLSLVLHLESTGSTPKLTFFYRKDRISQEAAWQLAALYRKAIQEIAANADHSIGKLALDLHKEAPAVSSLGAETFHFG